MLKLVDQTDIRIKSGFTLIEILTVTVVIAILAGITVVGYRAVSIRATNSQLANDVRAASKSVQSDYLLLKMYPAQASEVDDNKGFKVSAGTNIAYSVSPDRSWYCVGVTSSKQGSASYYIEVDGEMKEGTCPAAPVTAAGTPPPATPPPSLASPTVPTAPTVSSTTSGSTTMYDWNDVGCNVGYPEYEYIYTNSVYTSPSSSTTSRSVPFNTATQGYSYTVQVRAKCVYGSNSSGWSAYGSNTYDRPVTNLVQIGSGSNSLYVTSPSANSIYGSATVTGIVGSCASGTIPIARYNTQLNQGSWVNASGYVNYANGWTVTYTTDMDLNDMLEFGFWAKCSNPTTDVGGSAQYSDAYGNLIVNQNRLNPTRGTWERACGGHNSNPTQSGWCATGNYTFPAFP